MATNTVVTNIYSKVLISCHQQLVSGIKGGVKSLADALYQNGFISKDELDRTNDLPSETKTDKARRLVDAIENKVKCYPHNYRKFVDILRKKSPLYDDLVLTLDAKLTELRLEEESGSRSPSVASTCISSQSGTSEQFKESCIQLDCPCGQCQIREFIEGDKCPKSSPKDPPQLEMCAAADIDSTPTKADMSYKEYRIALNRQACKMQAEYNSLLAQTMNELKKKFSVKTVKNEIRRLITPQGAKKSLYSRMYDRGVSSHEQLRNVKTYDELREYIDKNFCSWFNVELIADLRKVLLYREGPDTTISAYEKHLRQYMIRCCFKRVVFDQDKYIEVVCKLHSDCKQIKEKQLDIFEYKLRQFICLPQCDRRVDTASGDLIFTMKQPVSSATRRMTQEHVMEGFSTLGIDESHQEPEQHNSRKKPTKQTCGFVTGFVFVILSTIWFMALVTLLMIAYLNPLPIEELGYKNVYGQDTVELINNYDISHLAERGKLIFSRNTSSSTNSSINIYMQECDKVSVYSQTIHRLGTVMPGSRRMIDRKYLTPGSNITVNL